MVEHRRGQSLSFHLAACVLVVLLNELRRDLLTSLASEASTTSTPHPTNGYHRSGHLTRFKLASAFELQPPAESVEQLSHIYQYDTGEDLNLVSRALARLYRALPTLDLNYTLLRPAGRRFEFEHLDKQIDAYYHERFPANMTVDALQLMSVKAALRMPPIPQHTSWGYETRELLREGSKPVVNDELCSLQLAHLSRRLDATLKAGATNADGDSAESGAESASGISSPVENFEARQIYRATDLEIMRLMDVFGRVPADLLRGNVKWYGSYSTCIKTRLLPPAWHRPQSQLPTSAFEAQQDQQQAMKFRYCMGAYRSLAWRGQVANSNRSNWIDYGVGTMDINLNNHFIRVGMCLPEACDSSALERPGDARALERMLKFNLAKPFNSDHYKLDDLYCLPDSRSPLRTIPMLGKLLLLATISWLGIISSATMIHLNVDKLYTETVERIRQNHQETSPNRTRQQEVDEKGEQVAEEECEGHKWRNEFTERDFSKLKLNMIKFSMYLRDKARQVIPGVDLIECLSLYSNWLKYTRRFKLAIVRMHNERLAAEKRRLKNEQLIAERKQQVTFGVDHRRSYELAEQTNAGEPAGPAGKTKHILSWQPTRAAARSRQPEVESAEEEPRVDTSPLNALKVIALIWIIAGHCIFYLGSVISNGALLTDYLLTMSGFALTHGAMHTTELFFVVTGCLTSYLTFKQTTRLANLEVSAARDAPEAGQDQSDEQVELRPHCSPYASAIASSYTNLDPNNSKGHQRRQLVPLMERRLFSPLFWLLFAMNRYLRILPTYLLCYAAVKLVTIYVGGEGQLWDYAVSANSIRRGCIRESWLPVLTLSTNYVDIYTHCIASGWYLSTDMQFALMAIPLLVMLAHCQRKLTRTTKNGRRSESPHELKIDVGPTLAGGVGSVSQQSRVVHATSKLWLAYSLIFGLALLSALLSIVFLMLQSQVDISYILRFSPHATAVLSQNIAMYTNSIFRFRAFAMGMLLGHVLFMYEFNLIRLPKFVQQHGTKLAVVVFSANFCIMFMPALYRKIILSHETTSAFWVLASSSIDLLLCLLIFLICIGKTPEVVLFGLNSPFWSLLSSLSLSAFLVHIEVIVLLTSQMDPPPSVSHSLVVFVFGPTVLITYSLALGLYLTFELPISRLIEQTMRSFVLVDQNLKLTSGRE